MGYKLISLEEVSNLEEILEKEKKSKNKVVFLGGNCRGHDWRRDVLKQFANKDITFINPRRTVFPDPELSPEEHAGQVMWERQGIDAADVVIFWLGEGLSNQASRVEIGYAIGCSKQVIIGADREFLGVEHLTAFSGMAVSNSLEGLVTRLESLL